MCSALGKRTSSFRIEDILKNKATTRDRSHPTERRNAEVCEKAKASGKRCEPELRRRDNSELLRRTLSYPQSCTSRNYNSPGEEPANLIYADDPRRGLEVDDRRMLLGHNERTSAFMDVGRYSYMESHLGNCQTDYGATRLGYPGGHYSDSYGNPYSSDVTSPVAVGNWPMLSGFLPSPYPPGPSSYPPYPLRQPPYHPVSFTKRKGGQVRFTPQQTQNLERRFGAHQYLSPEDRRILAEELKLTDRQVKTWFQNRRAKWRRSKNLTSFDHEYHESDNNQSDEDHELSSPTANRSSIFRSPENSPISVG